MDQPKTIGALMIAVAQHLDTDAASLRGITVSEESIAELSMLCGFDDDLAAQITQVRNRLPGARLRTAARILTEVVGKDFATAGHLASYAGIAPVTRRSGSSFRGE